jgi:hypothetical protein
MRQMFTCPLKDTSKESIDAAYREIYNGATAMGFTSMREDGVVKRDKDGKLYLDVPLYTADESKLII